MCTSEYTDSVDLPTEWKQSLRTPIPRDLNKETWSKKERKEILTVQSSRKHSTPVGGLALGLSWKKNRKQSENIIFNSMDGWNTMEMHKRNNDFSKVSKSSVFSSNMGGPKKDSELKDFMHCSTKYTETFFRNNQSSQQVSQCEMSQINILSSETEYTPISFFPNTKDLQVSEHIQTLKAKSYIHLEKDLSEKTSNKQLPSKRTSLFVLDPLSSDRRRKSDLQKFPNESIQIQKMSFNEENTKEEQFSLAKQNQVIQRKLKQKIQKEEIQNENEFLKNLDKNKDLKNGYFSPKSKNENNSEIKPKEDTPIVQKFINSELSLETPNNNKIDFSNKINSLKNVSIMSDLRKKTKKANDLKRRLKRKLELKKQKEAAKKSETVSKSLENLNRLLVDLNSNKERKADYSQLDLNLMKTLSKSIHKSNLLKPQSRYKFVNQECSPENSEVLSIMGLIKEFLSSSQDPLRRRQTIPKLQSNKVKIYL